MESSSRDSLNGCEQIPSMTQIILIKKKKKRLFLKEKLWMYYISHLWIEKDFFCHSHVHFCTFLCKILKIRLISVFFFFFCCIFLGMKSCYIFVGWSKWGLQLNCIFFLIRYIHYNFGQFSPLFFHDIFVQNPTKFFADSANVLCGQVEFILIW